jgi:hypothetical protein
LTTTQIRLLPSIAAASAILLATACQERLAAPADCPNLCPGGYTVRDTVLVPVTGTDSSYEGYVLAGQGTSLRVSYQLPASEDRAVIKFSARPDSFDFNDTLRAYTIDSVVLSIGLQVRDTAVKNLVVSLYRLPSTLDSSFSFIDAETAFTPANVIDTFMVADSVISGTLTRTFKGATLTQVLIPASDTGVLAMGVQIRAAQPTGIRIGSAAGGTAAPLFTTYLHFPTPGDTSQTARTFVKGPSFARFLTQNIPVLDTTVLTVGGAPSSRSLIRFPWPTFLRDSAQLVRVTLELIPTTTILGLPLDTAFIQARPILSDFGGKSPSGTDGFYIAIAPLVDGQTDTVRLEVRRAVTLWQGTTGLPPAFILQLFPEGSSFTRATFGSSRSAGFVPRLRVTYALTFPFERP